MSYTVNREDIQKAIEETIEEKLYAGSKAYGAAVDKDVVERDTIPDGWDGCVVSLAITQDRTVTAWVYVAEKPVIKDGLNCGGLAGLGAEVPLLVPVKTKITWELRLTTTGAITVDWRIRVRHVKK